MRCLGGCHQIQEWIIISFCMLYTKSGITLASFQLFRRFKGHTLHEEGEPHGNKASVNSQTKERANALRSEGVASD